MADPKRVPWTTYQGLRASDFGYAIRGDLAPDEGFVDFDSEIVDVANLRLDKIPLVPFGAEGPPVVRLVSIAFFAGFGGGTVARPRARPPDLRQAKNFRGLQTFGTLRFSSERGRVPVTVSEVYIHKDTAFDIGRKSKDKKGRTRLRLTDARYFWPDFGECYGYVNVPLSTTGTKVVWDPRTIQPDGKPYALKVVLDWLFYHLPGPPIVLGIPAATEGREPPLDVVVRGKSPYPAIAGIMQDYGLSLSRQPDGSYLMWRRGAKFQVRQDPAITVNRSLEVRYPPPAVRIYGSRIRRNVHRLAVAVSHDLDGRIYPLHQVVARAGITEEYALSQMAAVGQRQYEAVGNEDLRKIAREDWGRLFQIATAVGHDGAGALYDVPILDPVIAVDTKTVAPTGVLSAPPNTTITADGSGLQEVRTIKPVVIGNAYGQRLLDTTGEPTLTVVQAFAAATRSRKDEILKAIYDVQLGRIGNRRFSNFLTVQMDLILTDYAEMVKLREKEFVRVQEHLDHVKASFATIVFDGNRWTQTVASNTALAGLVLVQKARIQALQEVADRKRAEMEAIRAERGRARAIFEKIRQRKDMAAEDRFWLNFGEVEFSQDAYTIDEDRGLITMNVSVGTISPPLVLNREHLKLLAFPTLNVFYGIAHNTLTQADPYNALGILGENGTVKLERTTGRWPHPAELSAARQFPVKGSSLPVVPKDHPEIVLYLDHNGDEFNGKSCDDLALRLAGKYLGGSVQQVEGISIPYEGWTTPKTMVGVDSVGWSYDGGKPMTSISYGTRYHSPGGGVESPGKASDARTVSMLATDGKFRVSH